MPHTPILLTGDTGAGKTSLLGTAAVYLWNKHGKRFVLYSCEAAIPDDVAALIRAGIVLLVKVPSRVVGGGEGLMEETLDRVCEGYLPAEWDPITGIMPPGVKLLPPTLTTWTLSCPAGHQVIQAPKQADLRAGGKCSTCNGLVVNFTNGRAAQVSIPGPHMSEIGGMGFDSLVMFCDHFLFSSSDRRGQGASGGLDVGEKSGWGVVRSGEVTLSSNSRMDFFAVQTRAERWVVQGTANIPGLLIPPIWTSIEVLGNFRTTDADDLPASTLPVELWGPKLAGKARTSEAPRWFGPWLGVQKIGPEYRLYLSEFTGKDGIPHRYRSRAPAGSALPEFLVDPPPPHNPPRGDGCPECRATRYTQFSLGTYFDLRAKAEQGSSLTTQLTREATKFSPAPPSGPGNGAPSAPALAAPKPPSPPPAPRPPAGPRGPLPPPRPPGVPPGRARS